MSDASDQRGAARAGRSKPLEEYGVIGDLQTLALVARDGSIDWLCLPRFDSQACFAALLDDENAGHWSLRPVGPDASVTREYVGESLVLRTGWRTSTGEVTVTDFMPPRGEAADVDGVEGIVEMSTVLALRFDYGSIKPWVRIADGSDPGADRRSATVVSGPHAVWVRSAVGWHHHDGTLASTFTVAAGDRVSFVMTYQASHLPQPRTAEPEPALRATVSFWEQWMSRCTYDGRWAPEVRRSLLLLKALTYAPTGGILAAGTTSLPEDLGGVRNWDYRYCWLRDATYTLQALLGTGFVDEAAAWRDWLVRAVAGDPAQLQIMYGLDGSQRLPEDEIDWLAGYAGSRPVRTGNAASRQLQLDVWGEVLDGLHLARETGLEVSDSAWDLQRALLDWLEGHWREADRGLWEVRGAPRHFVHSKVLAWAGFDRAVHTVEAHGLDGPVDRWRTIRDEIHREVCDRGFDGDRGTFTQAYGSQALDAALLLIPRVGFLPWDDPRVVGTVDAVRKELSHDGFLLRYDPSADEEAGDGLPGSEGTFVACTFWLVDALHGSGRTAEAEELFERLLELRNDLGILAEEYDVTQQRQVGNLPQAYSLVGLVNSARHLSGRGTRTSDRRSDQGLP
jgi:GH15 family glucan-1,4-alpha-glucosidase